MSFPPGTEMFQFPGFASPAYGFSGRYPKGVGCPIRISTDQRLLAAPHGFSQRATSFIASWCQGIHRMPFSRSRSTGPLTGDPLHDPPCPGTIHTQPSTPRIAPARRQPCDTPGHAHSAHNMGPIERLRWEPVDASEPSAADLGRDSHPNRSDLREVRRPGPHPGLAPQCRPRVQRRTRT